MTADPPPENPQPKPPAPLRRVGTPRDARPAPTPTSVAGGGRSLKLDPHGIYGTRTASRLRAARRRRVLHRLTLPAIVVAVVAGLISWRNTVRVPVVRADATLTLGALPSTAPALALAAGGRAVLLVPSLSGSLWALEAPDGAMMTPSSIAWSGAFPLRATPLVSGAIAYVPSEDGALTAVSWRDRRVLWTSHTGASISSRPALARVAIARPGLAPVGQRLLFVGNDEGVLSALEAGSGRLVWRRRLGGPVGSGVKFSEASGRPLLLVPLLSGLASRGGVWCLNARNGSEVWHFPRDGKTFGALLPPPAVWGQGEAARMISTDDGGVVSCLRLSDGARGKSIPGTWKTFAAAPSQARDAAATLRAEPVVRDFGSGARLFVGGSDGLLRCYNARDGQLDWQFDAGFPIRFPVVPLPRTNSGGRDRLLVSGDGDGVWLLDARDGTRLSRLRLDDAPVGAPLVVPQTGGSSQVFCLLRSGTLQQFALEAG